jgi:hypothetical protein
MDGATFDDLVKRLMQARVTRSDALRGVLASAAVGLIGATLTKETEAKKKTKQGGKKGNGAGKQKRQKVTLCHQPGTPAQQTLVVPAPAVPAHLGHGDRLGPCEGTTPEGKCVPLLQACVPLVGNPCCDANASCVESAAGDIAGAPDFACRDNSPTDCTSDAACQARFPNPDVVCRENIGGSFCPPVPTGQAERVRHCCAPKACGNSNECFSNLCCEPFIGPNTCCAIGQFCNRLGGCFTG